MTHEAGVVFLIDVDNTLLDGDRLSADVKHNLRQALGDAGFAQYWTIFEELRAEPGYVDYLGALQRYRTNRPHDQDCLRASRFLLDYPFADRVLPGAIDLLKQLGTWARTVIVSDGDVVLQPRKIERSGLLDAVEGRLLVYIHKERELADVERRYPAGRYIFVDDKPRILAAVKQVWGARVTTVFPCQGHYAHDPAALEKYPPADITIAAIGDLLRYDPAALVPSRRGSIISLHPPSGAEGGS